MSGGGQNTVVQNSQPPQAFMDAYNNVVSRGQTLANQPYQPYGGNLVAGLSPDQQAAISQIQGSAGIANPYINAAAQEIGASTAPLQPTVQPYIDQANSIYQGWNPENLQQAQQYFGLASTPINAGDIANYYNPWQKNVVDATQAQFNNQNAQQIQGVRGNAISQGAFGGDREAVAEGITSGQQQLAQAPVIAGLESQGFNTALSAAQQQKQMQQAAGQGYLGVVGASNQAAQGIQGLGQQVLGANQANAWLNSQAGYGLANLGNQAYQTNMGSAQALLGVGGLEQQIAQEQLNVPYEQYIASQAWPYQVTGWLGGLTSGVGGAAGGTSSSSYPGPSPVSQIAGLGLTGASMLGMTGAFGSGGWLTGAGAGALGAGAVDSGVMDAAIGLGAEEAGAGALGAIGGAAALARDGGRIPHRAPGGGISIPQLPSNVGLSIKGGNGIDIPQLSGVPSGGGIASVNDYLNANKGGIPPSQIVSAPPPAPPAPEAALPPPQQPPPGTPFAGLPMGGPPQASPGAMIPSINYTPLTQANAAGVPGIDPAAGSGADYGGPYPTSMGWLPNLNMRSGGGIALRRDDGGWVPHLPGWAGGHDDPDTLPPDVGITPDNTSDWHDDVPELRGARGSAPTFEDYNPPPANEEALPLPPQPQVQAGIAPPVQRASFQGPPEPPPAMPQQPPMGAVGGNDPLGGAAPAAPQRISDTGEPSRRAPWETLLAAGLGMMAGRSPHAGVNIGAGGLEGLKFGEQQRVHEENAELRKLQAQELAAYRGKMADVAGQKADTGAQRAGTYQQSTDQRGRYQQLMADVAAGKLTRQQANDQWVHEFRTNAQGALNDYRDASLNLHLGDSIQRGSMQQQRLDQSQQASQQAQKDRQASLELRRQALAQSGDLAAKRMVQTATNADLHNATQLVSAGMAKDIPTALKQVQAGRGIQGGAQQPAAPAAAPAAPPVPQGVPAGSAFSPSRRMWRSPNGQFFDAEGRAVPLS